MDDATQMKARPGGIYKTPRVATIIVNYAAADLVVRYFASLLAELDGLAGSSITIVDNASPGDDLAKLRALADHPGADGRVTVIASADNGGFARGNNIALRHLLHSLPPPEYFFLLNPDAFVRPGAIRALLAFMQTTPDAGIAGARLESEDGAPQVSAFRFFSIASEFEGAAKTGPISALLSGARAAPPQRDELARADWVCGAAALIRREVFEQAGLFDEEYFLYFEETDFMLQAKRAGWNTWYAPAARAVHLVGQSSGVTDGKLKAKTTPAYWYRSRAHYFKKNHGKTYLFFADLAWLAGAMIKFIRVKLSGKDDGTAWPAIRRFAKAQFGGGLARDAAGERPDAAMETRDHG